MTNKYVEFADKHGLTITGYDFRRGPGAELTVVYTKFLDGKQQKHLREDLDALYSQIESLIQLSVSVSTCSVHHIENCLPTVYAHVYEVSYVTGNAAAHWSIHA